MHWLLASALMFGSSVACYVVLRRSTLEKTPTVWNNFASFFIPTLLFGGLAVVEPQNLHLNFAPSIWLLLIFAAICFSYLGNLMSLKSIEVAPNVGFSLTLSKSYVVLTTLISVWLFQASLNWLSVLAIISIIGFSALISIDPKSSTNPNVQGSWLPLALGAFFSWGFLSLSSKYLLNNGVTVLERLLISMGIVTVITFIELLIGKHSWKKLTKTQLICLGLIGVTGASFNYFMQLAFTTAPNIGYVNAINAASIAAVTLLSAWFFGDELSLRKLVGVLGVTGGLVLLVLGT